MRKFLTIILLVSCTQFFQLKAQKIEDVKATVEGTTIVIRYTITAAKINQVFNIELYYSTDNGTTFFGPLQRVSGDIGDDITAGSKKIVWNVFEEVKELDDPVIFEIRAEVIEREIKRPFYGTFTTNLNAPIGFSIGQIGEISWFASIKLHPGYFNKQSTKYECNNSQVINFNEPGYYIFDDKRIHSRLSFIAGLNYQYNQFFYFYGGLGYGTKSLYWHINKYSYQDNTITGSEYVKHKDFSYSGVEAEAGCIYNSYRLILSSGISTLNFKKFDLNVGVGFMF